MKKTNIALATAVGMLIFGCTLTAIGFFMEPKGEVSNSVEWILGQSLMYAGAVFGLKGYVDVRLSDNK